MHDCDFSWRLFWQGTKLNLEATVASLPLDGEFLVLITFTRKNQKTQAVNSSPRTQAVQVPHRGEFQNCNLQSLPADATASQGISHENWLNGHTSSRETGLHTEFRSGNTHTRASEETWRAVAADLASFNTSPPVDPTVSRDGNAFSSLVKASIICCLCELLSSLSSST